MAKVSRKLQPVIVYNDRGIFEEMPYHEPGDKERTDRTLPSDLLNNTAVLACRPGYFRVPLYKSHLIG